MPGRKLKQWKSEQVKRGQNSAKTWNSFFDRRKDQIDMAAEIDQTARVSATLDKHEDELLKLKNVVGAGVSLKEKKGRLGGNIALSILVEKKEAAKSVKDDTIPKEIDGVETDVVEVGKIEPLAFSNRIRPAMPGYSIGHANGTAGTFGCMVRDLHSNQQQHLLLGNNHVMADTNEGRLGDPILQPGPYDGGDDTKDTIAILERFEEIEFGLEDGAYNLVDAAVARPVSGRQVTSSVIGSIMPHGVGQAFLGDRVLKAGRTTGVTQGRVISVNATIIVWFEGGPARFRHQILTTFMSSGGDSGSLLMDHHLNAVGLVFAGSPLVTAANHISDVESALGVRTLTAPRPVTEADQLRTQLGIASTAFEQPIPTEDEEDAGPQPIPTEDEEDVGPQPIPTEDEDDTGPQTVDDKAPEVAEADETGEDTASDSEDTQEVEVDKAEADKAEADKAEADKAEADKAEVDGAKPKAKSDDDADPKPAKKKRKSAKK